jgi:DMSO/TMAO reductase YedYZ molybdopterin-dependent catalytic subunit
VSLDTLLADAETSASFALVSYYGGYSTNLPLEDLTDHKAWIAFSYDGQELEAEHGSPARLLVPHLYLWSLGYHNYGDPWQEQRFWGD